MCLFETLLMYPHFLLFLSYFAYFTFGNKSYLKHKKEKKAIFQTNGE